MMTTRLAAVFIAMSLSSGITLALADHPPRKNRTTSRSGGLAATVGLKKQVLHAVQPRPRFAPTQAQVQQEIAQDFANLPDVGTKIRANSSLAGVDPKIQAAVVTRINAAPTPSSRMRHFSWLGDHPVRVRGWDGEIESMTPVNGGWSVTAILFPIVDHRGVGRQVFVNASVRESFLFDGNALHLVGSRLHPASNPGIVID